MTERRRLFKLSWGLPVGAVALVAHATILRYVLLHAALSGAVLWGVTILVVIKHLGLLGSLFALFRRQSRD